MVDSKKASQAGNKGRGMPHSLSWHKICIFAAVTPRHLKVSAASHLLMPQHWVRCDEVTQECSFTMHCASPFKRFVVHLVQSPLAAGRHPPLGGAPLLVSQLPLRALVAEDLHLRRITESSSDPHRITESRPGCSRGGRKGCPPPPWGRHTCRSGRAVEDLSLLFVY